MSRQGRRTVLALLAVLAGALLPAAGACASGITNSGGDLRDGWYGNQPRLAPDAVSDSSFGQLWDKPVDGQVYAQPLVVGTSVVVATERNKVYALDADSGQPKWSIDLGTPFPASLVGCADLTPDLGVTSTPVIDTATNTIYLTHKTYAPGSTTEAAYYLDALDASTGAERSGFPVRFQGAAQNAPGVTFHETTQMQRPGLLLMNGVIYAGFGGHCDIFPYQGWVFGIDAATGATKARWATVPSGNGAGIWQSGSGLMSDGPGRLFVSTGNGGAPSRPMTGPGDGHYGESIVRLAVQGDGTLKAADFFAPSDAASLDDYDADFASGGVTALRDDLFGTSKYAHVAVAVGKAGYVYLLNRDDLGGFQQGAGHGDEVIQRVGPYGGVWSRPGVWPGDGGWIAIPAASPGSDDVSHAWATSSGPLNVYRYRVGADGTPSLSAPVAADDAFGFGSSAPVVTSNGTTSGSAVLWIVWAASGSGANAQLRAYDPVPVGGRLRLRRSWPIGTSSKFAMPGVGNGRIYVGTRDGHVLGFGAPIDAAVQAPSTTFPTTTTGEKATANVQLSMSGTVHVSSVTATPAGTFAARPPAGAVPGDYTDGQSLTVPVDFAPTALGVVGGQLTVVTDEKTFAFSLTGTGQGKDPVLTASPPVVSFGGAIVGQQRASTVTLGNAGGMELKITGVRLPGAPFAVQDAPRVGDVIAPGEAINVGVSYGPAAVGDYTDDLVVETTGGSRTVGLSGSAGLGPKLVLTPAAGWAFGDVAVGQSRALAVTLANTGDSPMTITKSKPPAGGPFTPVDALDEGSVIPAGGSRTVRVAFSPTGVGPAGAAWTINGADGTGVHEVALIGRGVAPPDDPPASPDDPPPVLTPPSLTPPVVGQAIPPVPKARAGLRVTSARLRRDGRHLVVRGRVAKAAVGPAGLTVSGRVGRRVVTTTRSATIKGASSFQFTIMLPKAMKKWSRLRVEVRFGGSDRVQPATAGLVVVRGH